MKVAKLFRWEAAHRLPWHEGGCAHLHGHSYRFFLEVEGTPDERGMLVDFKEMKTWLRPLVRQLDHSTIVDERDTELLGVVQAHHWKHYVFPGDTTAENLCLHALEYVRTHHGDALAAHRITRIVGRLAETETCYAEAAIDIS